MKSAVKFKFFLVFIFSMNGLFAQVTPLITNVSNEISVVRTYPNGLIVAANSGNILRSDNFGSTFDIHPIVDLQNNEIPLAAIYDFHFFLNKSAENNTDLPFSIFDKHFILPLYSSS